MTKYEVDSNGDGTVDKKHSHTRDSFRRAAWAIAMGGGYFIAGFGTTYDGGYSDPGPFDPEALKNHDAEADLSRIREFFSALQWWKLQPHDELVSGAAGYLYCLAEPGNSYVVYAAGAADVHASIARARAVELFDPRSGAVRSVLAETRDGKLLLHPPDAQDWVFRIRGGRR